MSRLPSAPGLSAAVRAAVLRAGDHVSGAIRKTQAKLSSTECNGGGLGRSRPTIRRPVCQGFSSGHAAMTGVGFVGVWRLWRGFARLAGDAEEHDNGWQDKSADLVGRMWLVGLDFWPFRAPELPALGLETSRITTLRAPSHALKQAWRDEPR